MQRGIDLRVIVVDNASRPESRALMESQFIEAFPFGKIFERGQATPIDTNAVYLLNDKNSGYSAGNNLGARLAVKWGCEAVLIINPDVQIADPYYLASLWREMYSIPDCFVGSSRVVSLQGKDEHPLRDIGFWDELLWIRQYFPRMFRSQPYVRPPEGNEPVEADKLHGSCMLIRSSFLERINFLDEKVFLYCEESILAARVKAAGGRLFAFPRLTAVHAHVASKKENATKRMLLLIDSRIYFLNNYTGYGPIQLASLRASYGILGLLHRLKDRLAAFRR